MADNYLITGYWGEPHVTAENDRGINAAMFGTGRFVLPVGEQFRAEYIGNNTIRMYDGKLMDNGAAAGIPVGEYVDLLIANAGQGMKRNDLIVFQYSQDSSTLVESGVFTVIQGAETSGTASDPALIQEDLLTNGATFDQFAMWRVSVSGATISAPVKLFSVYQNNASHATDKNNPHGVTKSQVGIGNVPNVATNDQTPTFTAASALATLASGEKLSVLFGKIAKAITDLISHIGNKSNPHGVTAAQAGAVPTSRTVNDKALSGNISLSAADVSGMAGDVRKGAVVYPDLNALGLGLTAACTTENFVTQLSGYSNVQFMHRADDAVHLSDAPASYGTVEFHKGPNNSYVYGLMVDIYSNVFVYKYHSSQTATNGWKRISSGSLWTNASPTSSFNGQTITVSGMEFCRSIMIVLQAVNGCHMYHIAHRDISITHANTPTQARYDNGHYTVGRAVGVNFTNNTIQFGHGNQNGTQNQGVAVPIAVIGLN